MQDQNRKANGGSYSSADEENKVKCMTPNCGRDAIVTPKRGLCMRCYSTAKKMVESGETNWDELVENGLAFDLGDNAFLKAFKEKQSATDSN